MIVKFRIYLFEDKEMSKYNFRKDIRWKITSVTTILHTVRMQPKLTDGHSEPEKASWLQQFVFNAKCVPIMVIINAGEF